MPRPTRLRLLDERPVAPVAEPEPSPEPMVSVETASAIIAQLRAELAAKDAAAAEAAQQVLAARREAETAGQTLLSLRDEARSRIDSLIAERDQATSAINAARQAATSERKQTAAVATAVSLGLLRQIMAEAAKLANWIPALGALLGGFWLFDRTITALPSAATLGELALYGAVVVAPAVVVTLRGRV